MAMARINLFNVTFGSIGFILNVTTLTIFITNIFKTVMNLSTAYNAAAKLFLLTHYQMIKISHPAEL